MKKLLCICLFWLIGNSYVQTKVFNNSGQMQSAEIEIVAEERFENNGEVVGSKSVNIECGSLCGNGKIIGPKINIFAKEFNFRGVIDCSKECVITTKKKVDQKAFKMKNKGKFIFKIEPNLELPSKIKALEEIKNFKGPLSQYWEDVLKIFSKDMNNNTSICRVCVQFDINEKNTDNLTWENLKSKVGDISWFMRTQSPFDDKNIFDYINELPFDEVRNDKNITTKTNIKIIKTSEINNKIEDNCDYSKIILTYFILFDHSSLDLQNVFSRIDLSAREALNLHYTSLIKLQNNPITCNGYFYLFQQ